MTGAPSFPPLDGEGGLSAAKVGWGARSISVRAAHEAPSPSRIHLRIPSAHPTPGASLRSHRTLPIEGREGSPRFNTKED